MVLALSLVCAAVISSDDHCNTYFRACGGLQAAERQLLIYATAAMPALPARSSSSKANSTAAADPKQQQQQSATRAQVAFLTLLEAACRNEVTLEEAAADKKLLEAVVKLLCSTGIAVQEAAARLLFTASTSAGPRQQVCSALAAHSGAGLAALLALVPRTSGASKVCVMSSRMPAYMVYMR